MNLIAHCRSMARNDACSNMRLLAACCALSEEDFGRERVSFFPSLVATLNHVLIVIATTSPACAARRPTTPVSRTRFPFPPPLPCATRSNGRTGS